MSNVSVRSFTQRIVVDPATSSISVINAGPPGPPGAGGGGPGGDATVLDEDDFASNSAVYPPSQQSVAVWANAQFYTAAEMAALLLDTPVTIAFSGSWPSAAGVPANRRVFWIQPNVGGTSPPAGGRPGREPGDLVFIRQS